MRAVIFDFDGLLIDSEIISYRIYKNLLQEFDVSYTMEEYAKNYSGKTEVSNVTRLISTYHLPWSLDEGMKKVLAMENHFLEEGVALKFGAKELLYTLKEKGILLGLATSSTKERAFKILIAHHLENIFDVYVFANEVMHGKPAPDIFLRTCEKLQINPEECVVLEDSEAGIQAACDAQIPVICVPDMKMPHSSYLDRCETVLPSLAHVQDYLYDETATLIETQRLTLRKLGVNDFSSLCQSLQDESVIKAYEGAFSDDEVYEWLNKQLYRYKKTGMGLYAVIEKKTNRMIGQCGLTIQRIDDRSVVEIGYLFHKNYWHQGYAIEAARACKTYAFEHFGYDELYSIIRDNNIPSQRVALRNGMTCKGMFVKHYRGVEMPHLIFSVCRHQTNQGDVFYDTRDLKTDEIYLDLTHVCAAQPSKNWLPAYYFNICSLDGNVMGQCDLRIGHNEKTYVGGNIGYRINEAYRGHHYAAKACRLLFKLALKHKMHDVIITCDPSNLASSKTCELLGGKLIEVADISKDNEMYAEGKRHVMIYRFDLEKTVLELVRPALCHEQEVMAFKEEMFVNHDEFDGCAGLEESETYEQWLQFEKRLKAKHKQNYVPSDVYLAITQQDKRVVGIIDYRHFLSPFLFQFGGNIGYSIRPMERQKGYGKQMLHLMLKKCKENGEKKVLITCDSENEASRRVILANGGVLENEVEDHVSLSQSGIIQRYWIDLEKEI